MAVDKWLYGPEFPKGMTQERFAELSFPNTCIKEDLQKWIPSTRSASALPSVKYNGAAPITAVVAMPVIPMDTTTPAQQATNQETVSDGNSALGSTTHDHHARQPHTGKRKSATDVAGTKPCKSVKVESPVKSDASAVAAAGAATENIAELRDFDSDFFSEEHQPATVNTKKKVDVSNNACTFTWGHLCPGAPDMKVRIDPKAIGSLLNVTLFGWVPPAYRPAALLRTTLADSMRHTGSHRVSRIYGSVKLSIKLCGQLISPCKPSSQELCCC